jgi:hypothetical protein
VPRFPKFPRKGIASHILEEGRPAQPWTKTDGVHGSPSRPYEAADYLILNEDELVELWPNLQFDRPIVIRDKVAGKRKAMLSTDDYLNDLASLPNGSVNVQSHSPEIGIVTENISGAEARSRWYQDTKDVPDHPINLLDLGEHTSNEMLLQHIKVLCSYKDCVGL